MPELTVPSAAGRPESKPATPVARSRRRYTVEEYLDFERASPTKHESLAGDIYAMVGASEPHVLIVTNLVFLLKLRFRGRPCKVYANDLRLKVSDTGLYTYPDLIAICGETKLSDGHHDMIENPQVVIEVLSPSTEEYDRGEKLDHYKQIESLTDALLVAQDARRVEHHARRADGSWKRSEVTGRGVVSLPSIGCEMPLDEIYEQIELPA